jgi:hypothetical protein
VKNCFALCSPDSDRLIGSARQGSWLDVDRRICPDNPRHMPGTRRWNKILVEVSHNKREETIIWTIGDFLIHQSLLAEFQRKGFTGYLPLPARVRFRDGSESDQYREIIVTGWAGVAHPDSGIRLVEVCPACRSQTYSRSGPPKQLVDWSQWTGDHFFRVWPLPKLAFVTDEVAEFLKESAPRLFDLYPAEKEPCLRWPGKTIVEELSAHFPEDLAIKYGRPLGLE